MSNLIKILLVCLIFSGGLFSQTPTLQEALNNQTSPDTAASDTGETDTPVLTIPEEEYEQRIGFIRDKYNDLMEREEIQFNQETFQNVVSDIQTLFTRDSQIVSEFQNIIATYFSSWNNILYAVISAIIVIILIAFFFPLRTFLRHTRERTKESELLLVKTAGYILEIIVRALPTLILTLSIWLIALIIDLPDSLYYTILKIAATILAYKFARWLLEVILAPQETRERVVASTSRVSKYFFHVTRAFLQWTLLYAIIIFLLRYIEYRDGIIYFVEFVYRIGAIILFAVLFARRDFTLNLFAETNRKFYNNLIQLFEKIYYFIYGLLLFSGILSILGYTLLSGFIFGRVFYTAAIIILGVLLKRILQDILDWAIPEDLRQREQEEEEDETSQLWNRIYSVARFLIAAIIFLIGILLIAKSWWLLEDQGILESFFSFFTFTLFEIQETQITIWSFIKAIIIVILFIYFSKNLRNILNSRVLKRTSMDRGARHAILTLTHYVLLIVGVVVALESIGVNLTTLKVFAGALGLGIGFGLQNIANNFASGLIILFERPIKTKDFVHVGDVLGTITKISARSTTILTRDNIAIIVPNSDFIEKTVINWSLNDTPTRLHVPIGVEYGTDPAKIEEILLKIADKHPRVLKYPKSRVWFKEFGDSSLDFDLLVWINDPQEGVNNIRSDINFQIAEAFKEAEIGIPFPQRDVHLKIDSDDIEIIKRVFHKETVEQEDEAENDANPEDRNDKDHSDESEESNSD